MAGGLSRWYVPYYPGVWQHIRISLQRRYGLHLSGISGVKVKAAHGCKEDAGSTSAASRHNKVLKEMYYAIPIIAVAPWVLCLSEIRRRPPRPLPSSTSTTRA